MDVSKLIVIEGLDGSGKATQTQRLQKNIERSGIPVKKITFPDYKNPSSSLVKMYLDGVFGSKPEDVGAFAASAFYAVDRYASFKQFWEHDYRAGTCILADRYATSNAIYQLTKTKREDWDSFLNWLEDFEYIKLQLPRPDLVIYLDMPPLVSQKLMSDRYKGDESKKDLHESNVGFLTQCRQSALYAAKKCRWKIIPCASGDNPRTIEEIEKDIFSAVTGILEQ